jgi:hypothetical protein
MYSYRPTMARPGGRWRVAAAAMAVALIAGTACGTRVFETLNHARNQVVPPAAPSPEPRPCSNAPQATFTVPSYKGLNYGAPDTINGDYVGLQWLRSGTGTEDHWAQTKPRLQADLDFFQQQHMGRVIRIFVGLDQAMIFDPNTGFQGFYPQVLDNLDQALQMIGAHDMKALVVLLDNEPPKTNLGEFRFEALDGKHQQMHDGYLKAVGIFMTRFGANPNVVGWDLFNEAYNSLSDAGGLPPPRYDRLTVHQWLRDLYHAAKCAAPSAWFTVSDATELFHKDPPDADPYNGAVDFLDVHIYENSANLPSWKFLHMPIIIGEAASQLDSTFVPDKTKDAAALTAMLQRAGPAGASAVLAHAQDSLLFTRTPRRLTAAGLVIANYQG